jgi:hypothetical protein
MSYGQKAAILAEVEKLSGHKRQALAELVIPRSTYYRWRRGKPLSGKRRRPWNRITPEEDDKVLTLAREFPEFQQ